MTQEPSPHQTRARSGAETPPPRERPLPVDAPPGMELTETQRITVDPRLLDTRHAFDSVANVYDGPRGNNALIQRMRHEVWRVLGEVFPAGARLLDLGCGTGIDAVHLAASGYDILATDWSPAMVARTRWRAGEAV